MLNPTYLGKSGYCVPQSCRTNRECPTVGDECGDGSISGTCKAGNCQYDPVLAAADCGNNIVCIKQVEFFFQINIFLHFQNFHQDLNQYLISKHFCIVILAANVLRIWHNVTVCWILPIWGKVVIAYHNHVEPIEIVQRLVMNVGMEVFQGHAFLELVNITQFWLQHIVVIFFFLKAFIQKW